MLVNVLNGVLLSFIIVFLIIGLFFFLCCFIFMSCVSVVLFIFYLVVGVVKFDIDVISFV